MRSRVQLQHIPAAAVGRWAVSRLPRSGSGESCAAQSIPNQCVEQRSNMKQKINIQATRKVDHAKTVVQKLGCDTEAEMPYSSLDIHEIRSGQVWRFDLLVCEQRNPCRVWYGIKIRGAFDWLNECPSNAGASKPNRETSSVTRATKTGWTGSAYTFRKNVLLLLTNTNICLTACMIHLQPLSLRTVSQVARA